MVAFGGWLAVQREQDQAELVAVVDRLADDHLEAAQAGFLRLRDSRWVGARARAGLAVVDALRTAGPPVAARDYPLEQVRSFDLRRLLESALARREFSGGEALARLAGEAGEPLARAYLAAALLEQRRDDEARSVFDTIPESVRAHGLGHDVAQALDLQARGAGTVVRDRTGRLAGVLDSSSQLQLLDEATSPWVPGSVDLAPYASEPGVRLSVDFELSRLAEESLAGHRGSIVILDPWTGAVLAAVSDPRTRKEGGTPAFEQRREPASIAKIITTTAALRAGLDPDAEISRMICTGSQSFQGGTLWCSRPGGRLRGLDEALATSCNTAFAQLGVMAGRAAVVAEFRRYGFDGDFLGAGRVLQPEGDDHQLASLSVGLDATDITPLHAALLAAVVASGGNLPEPVLVTATDGLLGHSPRGRPAPPPRPVIDPRWVPVLEHAMEAVLLPGGTAADLAPPGFPVAMKTGTAAEWHHGYHVNYIGFGPLPDVRIAFCVRVTHEPSSWRAARAGREVTAALFDGLLRRWPALARVPRMG